MLAIQMVILVLDGTYIYIQTSDNFYFQRRSVQCPQRKIVSKSNIGRYKTGHFVTTVGIYLANSNNNAHIFTQILKSNLEDKMHMYCRPGLSRWYKSIEGYGIKTEIYSWCEGISNCQQRMQMIAVCLIKQPKFWCLKLF